VAVPVRMAGAELRWCQGLAVDGGLMVGIEAQRTRGTSSAAVRRLVTWGNIRAYDPAKPNCYRDAIARVVVTWFISLERHRNYGRVVVEEADMNP
jgi:hypothetical protein